MKNKSGRLWIAWALVLLASWVDAGRLWAGTPMEQIKVTVERVLQTLKEPRLLGETKTKERRELLRKVIAPSFDFDEMAKRSLGQHWQQNAARKGEFVPIFRGFVEDAYLGSIESYKNEKILYASERVERGFAQVDTKLVPTKGDEIPIHYRLHLVGGQWKIYDVLIENVSLVNNYRSQFHRVISTSSFDELLRRLQEKRAEGSRL